MATWGDLKGSDPAMAEAGRAILYQVGVGLGFLGTVRKDGVARIHPVCPLIADDRMFLFVIPSAKRNDLLRDGRYSLHSFPCDTNEERSASPVARGSSRMRRVGASSAISSPPSERASAAHSPQPRTSCSSFSTRLVLPHAHDRTRRPESLSISTGAPDGREDRMRCSAGGSSSLRRSSPVSSLPAAATTRRDQQAGPSRRRLTGVLTVATNLPAPGFWDGDDVDHLTGGFEWGIATRSRQALRPRDHLCGRAFRAARIRGSGWGRHRSRSDLDD